MESHLLFFREHGFLRGHAINFHVLQLSVRGFVPNRTCAEAGRGAVGTRVVQNWVETGEDLKQNIFEQIFRCWKLVFHCHRRSNNTRLQPTWHGLVFATRFDSAPGGDRWGEGEAMPTLGWDMQGLRRDAADAAEVIHHVSQAT